MRSMSEPYGYRRAATIDSAEHGEFSVQSREGGWGLMSWRLANNMGRNLHVLQHLLQGRGSYESAWDLGGYANP